MKLEDQLVNLELSKRMKELGVRQESLFYWADESIVINIDLDLLLDNNTTRQQSGVYNDYPDIIHDEIYSAFTVAELLQLLSSSAMGYPLTLVKHPIDFCCGYGIKTFGAMSIHAEKMSDAMAKMLIYLIENNLVDVNKLNGE